MSVVAPILGDLPRLPAPLGPALYPQFRYSASQQGHKSVQYGLAEMTNCVKGLCGCVQKPCVRAPKYDYRMNPAPPHPTFERHASLGDLYLPFLVLNFAGKIHHRKRRLRHHPLEATPTARLGGDFLNPRAQIAVARHTRTSF